MKRLVRGSSIDRVAHAAFGPLAAAIPEPRRIAQLVRWFTRHAGPSDASLAADVLEWSMAQRQEWPYHGCYRPLATWLLTSGAAELRPRRRQPLLVYLATTLFGRRELRHVTTALRFLSVSEARIGMVAISRAGDNGARFLQVLEGVARTDGRLALRLLEQLDVGVDEYVAGAVLRDHPHTRAALVTALLGSRIAGGLAASTWPQVFSLVDPPKDARFSQRRACLLAAQAFGGWLVREQLQKMRPREALAGPACVPVVFESQRAAKWARVLSAEVVRTSDLLGHGRDDTEASSILGAMLHETSTSLPGAHEGLVAAAVKAGTSLAADLRSLLKQGGPRATRVVLELLRTAQPSPRPALKELPWDAVSTFVTHPWHEPVGGLDVARLLGRARRVRPTLLTDEDKVRLDGEEVLVDEKELTAALDGNHADGERRALCALYFAHELVHLAQAIGDKKRIRELRERGLETTIMHLDLAADHLAALLVARAFPQWSLLHLKDLQGRGLSAFTHDPLNTRAARARKAVRLVSLRIDYLLRNSGHAHDAEGYVFADYGPTHGPIFALMSGPPTKVLDQALLDAKMASTLDNAADAGTSIASVDEVLRKAFKM